MPARPRVHDRLDNPPAPLAITWAAYSGYNELGEQQLEDGDAAVPHDYRQVAEEAEAECRRLARRLATATHKCSNLEHRLMTLKADSEAPVERSMRALIVVGTCLCAGPLLVLAWACRAIEPDHALIASGLFGGLGFLTLPGAVGITGKRRADEVENA